MVLPGYAGGAPVAAMASPYGAGKCNFSHLFSSNQLNACKFLIDFKSFSCFFKAYVPQPQPLVDRGPMYTDEDVKELHEMFPNIDDAVIRSVLDEKHGNKDATVNALLSITAE